VIHGDSAGWSGVRERGGEHEPVRAQGTEVVGGDRPRGRHEEAPSAVVDGDGRGAGGDDGLGDPGVGDGEHGVTAAGNDEVLGRGVPGERSGGDAARGGEGDDVARATRGCSDGGGGDEEHEDRGSTGGSHPGSDWSRQFGKVFDLTRLPHTAEFSSVFM
jgi:hypothetical protein